MTRATRGGRARTSAGSPDAGQHGGSPRPRRKQPHNSRSSQTPGNISDVSTAIVSHTAQRLPPVMAMPPEARSVWNLKILRRHDPLISRIFDQAPYGVLYTFNHAHAHEPDGGKGRKYEGTWEKTGIEGTVFLVERNAPPQYGFFLLNRGGTSSIFQMLHSEDTVELGADPKFLTFRPGLWDRATTPYNESAGPRFAYFMSRAKKLLSYSTRAADVLSSSPPPTPLSQVYHSFAARPNPGVVGKQPDEVECPQTPERPLEKLFASLAQPLQSATDRITPQAYSSTTHPNSTTGTEETRIHAAPTDSVPMSNVSAQVNPLSLLDQIFASVVGGENSVPLADGLTAIEADPARPRGHREKGAPTTPSPTALNSSVAAFRPTDSDHTSTEDYDDDRDEFFFADESLSSYWAARRDTGAVSLHSSVRGDVSGGKAKDDSYQELEAPSPSLIPNPLRTPMPSVTHRIETRNAVTPSHSHSHTDLERAENFVLKGHSVSLDHHELIHQNSGLNAMQQLAESASIEAVLDVNMVTAALLDSLRTHSSGGAEGMRSDHLSKRDFVSELLTLIQKEPDFVDDLYARYETLIHWNQRP